MSIRKFFAFVSLFLCCITGVGAASNQSPIGSTALVFPTTAVSAGDEVVGSIKLTLEPGWHIYWKNPGDVGLAPSFTWELPDGVTLNGEPLWPAPTLFKQLGSPFYGYEGTVEWVVRLKFRETLAPNTYPIVLHAFYLACGDSCTPFTSKVEVPFTISLSTQGKRLIEELPADVTAKIPVEVASIQGSLEDSLLTLTLPLSEEKTALLKEVVLFPEKENVFPVGTLPSWEREDTSLNLTIPLSSFGKDSLLSSHSFSGLVQLVFKDKQVTYSIHTSVESIVPSVEKETRPVWKEKNISSEKDFSSLPLSMSAILFAAFIGGLLLNFTPCVLPVVGIKILHLLSFKGERKVFLHGLSFTLGVLTTFWILAGGVYFLEHAGNIIGWGFQLQQPLFVAFLILFLFVFAMNLFGVFEFGSNLSSWASDVESAFRQSKPSYLASFLSGLLATVIATPCTGPLLGSVLGFAATFDPWDGMYLFTAIGLGMSFPFLFITLFPICIRLLPRPGLWMISLKQFFGFCMLGTILWLLWVLNSEVLSLSLLLVFLSFFVLALSLWMHGKWGSILHSLPVRIVANTIAFLFLISGAVIFLFSFDSPLKKGIERFSPQYQRIEWKPFSKTALTENLEKGRTVFVSFSAKWCLTCQLNKLIFLTPQVIETFQKERIVALEADWTNGDEAITEMLRSLGRNGVPVYAIFSHDKEPFLLQELLTADVVTQSVTSAAVEK